MEAFFTFIILHFSRTHFRLDLKSEIDYFWAYTVLRGDSVIKIYSCTMAWRLLLPIYKLYIFISSFLTSVPLKKYMDSMLLVAVFFLSCWEIININLNCFDFQFLRTDSLNIMSVAHPYVWLGFNGGRVHCVYTPWALGLGLKGWRGQVNTTILSLYYNLAVHPIGCNVLLMN